MPGGAPWCHDPHGCRPGRIASKGVSGGQCRSPRGARTAFHLLDKQRRGKKVCDPASGQVAHHRKPTVNGHRITPPALPAHPPADPASGRSPAPGAAPARHPGRSRRKKPSDRPRFYWSEGSAAPSVLFETFLKRRSPPPDGRENQSKNRLTCHATPVICPPPERKPLKT